jgi:hypothetical protein
LFWNKLHLVITWRVETVSVASGWMRMSEDIRGAIGLSTPGMCREGGRDDRWISKKIVT